MKFYTHQGDVPIFLVEKGDKIPQLKEVREKSVVIKKGETTGHSHRVVVADPVTIEVAQDEKGFYVKSSGESSLVHEEHGTITLQPSETFFFGSQFEYDPITYKRMVSD